MIDGLCRPARPSIMMNIEQAVMMALATTVVTPLIGGGLGQEAFGALAVVKKRALASRRRSASSS